MRTSSAKECRICGNTDYERYPHNPGVCKPCYAQRYAKWAAANKDRKEQTRKKWVERIKEERPVWKWARVTAASLKKKSLKLGLPYDLSRDILEQLAIDTCPVLGIPLCYTHAQIQDDSPSVDRFYPARGYVQGNVFIISAKANRIKNDASLEELLRVAEWMQKIERSQP